ncbi:LysR family transcriptional regulator [Methylobacterium sp. J-077]|uniref:LysR family transcriptional regulator n=1 Tax=Methylobacterium sp. J-077 TaxID=2836656 RepID=UPI001FB9B58F|nr:LysR family transcriptional regulator [Methylobacterium sp. J-077]MCJ2121881.1 LysR family transcriptional regulator [Methylobacterium sp. J-077]
MDTLEAMHTFVRVVQAGTFSAAGRQLGLSPATVLRAINALEDKVGARLFNRSSRRMTLTEAGEIYAMKVDVILNDIADLSTEMSRLQTTPRGILRVQTRVSLGIRHIAPLLPAFLERHCELKIDLRLSDGQVDFSGENIDVAIGFGPMTGATLLTRKLVASPRVVCASLTYVDRFGTPTIPSELSHHNCLTFRSQESQPIWRFLRNHELIEIRVSGNLQADYGDVLREAALSGLGIVLLPAWTIADDIKAGRLVGMLPDYQASPFGFDHDVQVFTHRDRHRTLKVQFFFRLFD